MNVKDLVDAGYKPFKDSFDSHAEMAYQKRIDSEYHKLYFINVYHYDMSPFVKMGYKQNDAFDCKIQFDRTGIPNCININFSCTDLTIQELEDTIAHLFKVLEGEAYE